MSSGHLHSTRDLDRFSSDESQKCPPNDRDSEDGLHVS